jgi:hypothetical protein
MAALLLALTGCTNKRDLGNIPDGGAGATGNAGTSGGSGSGAGGQAGAASGAAGDGGGGNGGNGGNGGSISSGTGGAVGGATGAGGTAGAGGATGAGGTAGAGGATGAGGAAGAGGATGAGGAAGAGGATGAGGTAGAAARGGAGGTAGGVGGGGGAAGAAAGSGGTTGAAGAGGTTGARWTFRDRTPATMTPWPVRLTGVTAAYDSTRKRVVLYGGVDTSVSPPVTSRSFWFWDGATGKWDTLDPPPATLWPPLRSQPQIAYDAARDRIVLWGGSDASGFPQDTWEWDGVQWANWPATSNGPVGTNAHTMTYADGRGTVMLFDTSSLFDWDGANHRWVMQAFLPLAMTGVSYARLAWDSLRSKVVLYGGYRSNEGTVHIPSKVLDWDSTNGWLDRKPATLPAAWPEWRRNLVVYDSRRSRLVIYGANSNSVVDPGYVWEWDGARNSWTRRDDAGIGPPNLDNGIYDPDRDVVVGYVGFYSQFEMKNGMWEYTSP